MVDAVQNISATIPQAVSRNDLAPPPQTAPPVAESESNAPPPQSSPRIQVDPVVGVILEFLSSTGSVVSQSPSFAAEAYLRAGLTSDGFPKSDPEAGTQLTA